MTKILSGSEIAAYVKERQAKTVRSLKQAAHVNPKLAIIQLKDDAVINTYVRLKQQYGEDIGVAVEVHTPNQDEALGLIETLNADDSVHGIIIQLPIPDPSKTDELCDAVAPQKDVDALGVRATLDPATPLAILWLLAGYDINLQGKDILLIGQGKLVGRPLARMLVNSGFRVRTADRSTADLREHTLDADIIITATGSPAILFPDMVKEGVVIIDAGVASEDGKTVGDVHESMYDRQDIAITPVKGGVGPLTVTALFENVLTAARALSV